MGSISYHITPLLINSLRGVHMHTSTRTHAHAHTRTHTHTHTHTHTDVYTKKFRKVDALAAGQ